MTDRRKLRVFMPVQIGIPGTLLAWRLLFDDLPFGGWAWAMYS